jgi:hypothetical protein
MDAFHFDRVTRTVSTVLSRRTFARVLSLGAIALPGLSDAKRTRKKKRCKRNKKKCGKRCFPRANCCNSADCAAGELCIGGQCVIGAADCPAAANSCQTVVNCTDNPACLCFQRLEGGVRCVQLSTGACDQCATDADCATLGFPPGSSCIQDDGPGCTTCAADDRGLCALPCGDVP